MTDEDTAIWLRLGAWGRGWTFMMPAQYLEADQRDARLMLSMSLPCPHCGGVNWWPFEWTVLEVGLRCGGEWVGHREHPGAIGCGNIKLAGADVRW